MPKWAKEMAEELPLHKIIDKETQRKLKASAKDTIEFQTSGKDVFYKEYQWKVNDIILRNAGINPANAAKEGIDHAQRLAEIYRKFLDTYERFQKNLEGSGAMITDPKFDPKIARERLENEVKTAVNGF